MTILLSSHLLDEVEELCNRVAIIRKGAIVYEGALERAARDRGQRLPPARDRRRARARGAARPAGHRRRRAARRRPSLQRRRGRGRGAVGRARPGRHRVHRARARDRDPRGALPRDDRRRVVRSRPGRRGGRMTAVARVYRWELASCSRRSARTSGSGRRCSCRSSSSSCSCCRPAGRTTCRSAATSARPGWRCRSSCSSSCRSGGCRSITALVAGDIVAVREPQRDAEDDPHALARPWRGLRGQGARDVDLHASALVFTMGVVGLVAGSVAWGFHPLTSLSGTKVSPGHGLLLLAREPAASTRCRWPGSRRSACCSRRSRATALRRSSAR